jgi:hypothetical protein
MTSPEDINLEQTVPIATTLVSSQTIEVNGSKKNRKQVSKPTHSVSRKVRRNMTKLANETFMSASDFQTQINGLQEMIPVFKKMNEGIPDEKEVHVEYKEEVSSLICDLEESLKEAPKAVALLKRKGKLGFEKCVELSGALDLIDSAGSNLTEFIESNTKLLGELDG